MFYTEVPLSDVADAYTGKQLNKSAMSNDGLYAVINGGVEASGYTNNYNEEENTITISQGGASAGFVNWNSKKIWIGAHCYAIHPKDRDIDNRFLYFVLKEKQEELMQSKQGAGIPGINRTTINKLLIPLPHIKVQEEIVKILDYFTNLIDALNEELSLRQKQFEYYREKLLTFDDSECEWKKLSDVAEIGTGSGNTNEGLNKGLYPFFTRGQEKLWKNDYEFDEEAVITAGDGVGVGKVMHYIKGKYSLHQRAYRFKPQKILVTKFLYHYMKVTFYNYVCENSVSSSVSSLRKPKLMVYPIPIPPLAIQQTIVEKLDAFESLISSLKEEIALRQKQYEYYREKLLTFE